MAVDLVEEVVRRVIAADGTVESASTHGGLERACGIAALLRHAPA